MRDKFQGIILLLIISTSISNSQSLKLDRAFANDGVLVLTNQNWQNEISFKVFQWNNSLYLLHGVILGPKNNRLSIYKMSLDGKPDRNYFDNGLNITSHSVDSFDAFDYNRQSISFNQSEDDKILLLSTMRSKTGLQDVSLCFKIDYNGNLDSTFADTGNLLILPTYRLLSSKVNIFKNGDILVTILEQDTITKKYLFEIRKFHKNGISDFGFGNNGLIQIDGMYPIGGYQFVSDANNDIYLSYNQDSTNYIHSFKSDGTVRLNFGNNGILRLVNKPNRNVQITQIIIVGDFIYLYILETSRIINIPDEYNVLRIDKSGVIDNLFGSNSFLNLTDTTLNEVHIHYSYLTKGYLVSVGGSAAPNFSLNNIVYTLNGQYCCDSNLYWKLSYDSLRFRPYPFSYSNFNDELYAIGKFRDASVNSNNLVILNLIFNVTTSTDNSIETNIELFPNPSDHHIFMRDDKNVVQKALVYNLTGQLIFNKEFDSTSNKSINLDLLLPGSYIILLTDKLRKVVYSGKFVKNTK